MEITYNKKITKEELNGLQDNKKGVSHCLQEIKTVVNRNSKIGGGEILVFEKRITVDNVSTYTETLNVFGQRIEVFGTINTFDLTDEYQTLMTSTIADGGMSGQFRGKIQVWATPEAPRDKFIKLENKGSLPGNIISLTFDMIDPAGDAHVWGRLNVWLRIYL